MHCFLQPSEEFEHLTFLSTRVAKAQAVLASPARPARTIANAHPRFLSAIACGISCLKQTWPKSPVTSAILHNYNQSTSNSCHQIAMSKKLKLSLWCEVLVHRCHDNGIQKWLISNAQSSKCLHAICQTLCSKLVGTSHLEWHENIFRWKQTTQMIVFWWTQKAFVDILHALLSHTSGPQMGIKIQVSSQYIGTDTIRCSTQTFLQFRKTSKTSRILMKQIEKAFPPICELRHSIFTSCIHQRLLVDFQGSISPCGVGNALGIKLPHEFCGLRVGFLPCSRGSSVC